MNTRTLIPLSRAGPALASMMIFLLLGAPGAAAQSRNETPEIPADTARVFMLGTVEVTGSRITVARALAEHIPAERFRTAGRQDLSDALPLAAGLTLQRVGPRNEAGLRLRGSDLRHVPLYVDGIPVYVPYDGFVDLARFVTADTDRIIVSKGFSSLLYGPNALAGAINLVTRTPVRRIDSSVEVGWHGPTGREAAAFLGTRQKRWFALGNLAYRGQDTFALSGGFEAAPYEDGGRRENASWNDVRMSAKVGFVPNERTTYAVAYVSQQGDKGNPPFAGADEDIRVRYWQWPRWDKESVYLLADQAIGSSVYLRSRLYYDRFAGALFSYDDASYSAQTKPFAFRSFSDDDTYGGNLQLTATAPAGHLLGVSLQIKQDRHRERDRERTLARYEDLTWSVSFEDDIALGRGVHLLAGMMYSERRTPSATQPEAHPVFPRSKNESIDGNAALLIALTSNSRVFTSIGRRTRFPTMKDRFDYRQGRAVPNPFLRPEHAWNLQVGFDGALLGGVPLRAVLFHSRIDDVILAGEVSDPVSNRPVVQLQNAGRARHRGGEVALGFVVGPRLRGEGSYAFVQMRSLSAAEHPFTHTPTRTVRIFLEADLGRAISARGWLHHAGSRRTRVEGTGLTELDGHVTIDCEGLYTLAPGLRLSAGIRNLLDANYQIVAGYPEPGRTPFVRMAYAFARP